MEHEMNQGWEFRKAGTGTWRQAVVPGSVHTDLQRSQLIPDPFFRMNEKELQWIDKADWEYRTYFMADRRLLGFDVVELIFEGLDTYADVFLNDQLILQTDNMFRTWKANVKDKLKNGENELRVLLKSPTREGLLALQSYGFQLPADNDQSQAGEMEDHRVSPYVRKAPYHFGWDWGPRIVTSGIWRSVKLVAWDELKIEDVWIRTHDLNEYGAKVALHITVQSVKPDHKEIKIHINDSLYESGIWNLESGITRIKIPFTIDNPRLWWPNGMGEQNLYHIRVEISDKGKICDSKETVIGLRKVELVQETDQAGDGKSFYFRINDRPVFAKGANYIPNDVFLDRANPEKYEYMVRSAAEANMNMLRVWGGGIYEHDIFYDLCDQYGIMVWQDFMFACAMYPGDDDFLENVRVEAEQNIRRLRSHPSLVIWCGNNEIEAAWGQYEENRGWGWKQRHDENQRKIIWKAYDTLFHKILPEVIALEDPDRPYWHSSPSAGMGKLASYESTSGDMHYWGVWHGLHPFSDFRKYRARFMSEYGFQSFPEYSTVQKYAVPEDFDIESEVMMAHQRSGIGNLRIRQYMEQDYKVPVDFEAFLYVSQLLQGEAIKMAIESHRADMPYCMGTMYWQLNDCWPAASWSGIDYFGRWKALHYFVKEAFKSTVLVVAEDNGSLEMRLVSDEFNDLSGIVEMKLISFSGEVIWNDKLSVEVPSQSFHAFATINSIDILGRRDPAGVVLLTKFTSETGQSDVDYHYFVKPKHLLLDDPNIEIKAVENDDNLILELLAKKLAKNVFLSVEGLEGRFSDNFFDLMPGEIKRVQFPKTGSVKDFEKGLSLIHLQMTMNGN